MAEDWVFGYGSLVNADTHGYPETRPANLHGWRRDWRHWVDGPARRATALTIEPDPDTSIAGLIARVPAERWADLEAREAGYNKLEIPADHIDCDMTGISRIYTFQSATPRRGCDTHPIPQSYLDCVLKGFLDVFGEDSLDLFLQTTDGWDSPIDPDRAAPKYPRAVPLSEQEIALFDTLVRKHGGVWLSEPM